MKAVSAINVAFGLHRIGVAFTLGLDRVDGETVSAWKRRRSARRASLRKISGAVLSDQRADEIWDKTLRSMSLQSVPTGHRATKSAKVAPFTRLGRAVRLSGELPAGVRQLHAKGMLTDREVGFASRFRADHDLAYYSGAGMTVKYDAVGGGSGMADGVASARGAVMDARDRLRRAEAGMTAGCWDVLNKMVVMDIAQVNVGGVVDRYRGDKARRSAAGMLLMEALGALGEIYC